MLMPAYMVICFFLLIESIISLLIKKIQNGVLADVWIGKKNLGLNFYGIYEWYFKAGNWIDVDFTERNISVPIYAKTDFYINEVCMVYLLLLFFATQCAFIHLIQYFRHLIAHSGIHSVSLRTDPILWSIMTFLIAAMVLRKKVSTLI